MLAPEVLVASLASFGERGVVVLEAADRAVVGHAYQEGATEKVGDEMLFLMRNGRSVGG